ncbi:MAG TPA: DUF4350 domain-containing protein [Candidatus Margulisiibacteriota bacterium]|nr:DUF4350 domain-containing protein [Candidatus Margulisiibacteriota bacterium]
MAALLASCGLFFAAPRAAHPGAKPVVLFDEAHGQRFLAAQNGPLDLSRLAEVLENQGFEIKTANQLLTEPLLAHVDALVISGAFKLLTAAEVEAVTRFVERGGRLAVMLHIGPPVADLLHRLHTSISNGVICEPENIIGDTCTNFRVTRFKPHDLTKGLQEFSIFGGWALLNTGGNTSIVAETGPRAWVDLNGDGKLGAGDAIQAFGVVVAGQVGRGRFVVFGDDAIFQNQFLKEGNLLLAKNLAAWLAQLPA